MLKKLYHFTTNWLAPGICFLCGCEVVVYNLVRLRLKMVLLGLLLAANGFINLYFAWRKEKEQSNETNKP